MESFSFFPLILVAKQSFVLMYLATGRTYMCYHVKLLIKRFKTKQKPTAYHIDRSPADHILGSYEDRSKDVGEEVLAAYVPPNLKKSEEQ